MAAAQQTSCPSFIGIQVQKYLGVQEKEKKGKPDKKRKKDGGGYSHKLAKETKEFIDSLEGVMFI